MYKRILIPVDGSATSDLALQEAIKLAEALKSQLHIVHITDESPLYTNAEGFVDIGALRDALRDAGKHILEKAEEHVKKYNIPAETVLLETSGERVANLIAEEARRWPAELIMMGSHGRRGFDRFIMGSVAEGVARIAPVPVLIVRGE